MKEEEITSQQQKIQTDLLDILKRIVGTQFWIPEKGIESIIPDESGGCCYRFNASIIGTFNEPKAGKTKSSFKKLEIYVNRKERLLLQLPNGKNVTELPCPHSFFKNIEDFRNKISDVKEMVVA